MLYGCETKSLALKEECRLGLLENRIPRQIFGLRRRRFHNGKLLSLCRSPNIVRAIKSRRVRWAGHVATMQEGKSAFKVLIGKPTKWELFLWKGRRWITKKVIICFRISTVFTSWVDFFQIHLIKIQGWFRETNRHNWDNNYVHWTRDQKMRYELIELLKVKNNLILS